MLGKNGTVGEAANHLSITTIYEAAADFKDYCLMHSFVGFRIADVLPVYTNYKLWIHPCRSFFFFFLQKRASTQRQYTKRHESVCTPACMSYTIKTLFFDCHTFQRIKFLSHVVRP